MQPVQMTTISPLDKLADSFFGRLALTVLSVVVAALATPFLFLANSILLPIVLRWTALAWLGLVAGLAARGFLHRYHSLVRLFSAWGILLGCLWLVYQLTYGYVGIHPLLRSNSVFDWDVIQQVLFSGVITWLALFAQRKPRVRVSPAKPLASPEPLTLPKAQPSKSAKQPKQVRRKNPQTNASLAAPALPQLKPWQPNLKNLGNRMRLWRRKAGQAASHSRQKAGALWERSRQALRLRVKPSSRQVSFPPARFRMPAKPNAASLVQLVGVEEHRCPYCLELVEPKDPRGIKICPECHTYHHADCWTVTGACQVPHHHA